MWRFFLIPNSNWQVSKNWYKNSPIGKNTFAKWMKNTAKEVGLDIENKKITNHSLRASAVL